MKHILKRELVLILVIVLLLAIKFITGVDDSTLLIVGAIAIATAIILTYMKSRRNDDE